MPQTLAAYVPTVPKAPAAKIEPIIADRQQKLKAIYADTTASKADRKTQAKSVYTDSDAQIKAILTPDQQHKYAAMEQQMKSKATKHAATTE